MRKQLAILLDGSRRVACLRKRARDAERAVEAPRKTLQRLPIRGQRLRRTRRARA